MKKTVILTIFLLSFVVSEVALAKTDQFYLGFDVIRTDVIAGDYSQKNPTQELDNAQAFNISEGEQYSVGFNVKYAINFDGIFIAPGLFYEYANVVMTDKDGSVWALDHRYGIRFDLGYDVSDKFAPYFIAAIVANDMRLDQRLIAGVESEGSYGSMAYGLGVKYEVIDDFDLKLEYEISLIEQGLGLNNGATFNQEFDVDILRIGVAYGF